MMIDLSLCNEWQHRDQANGLVLPWYTKPALDEILTWDLKDKVVFEYGCGASSLWWAAKCWKLAGVEYSRDYADTVNKEISQRHPRYARSWPVCWYTDEHEYIHCIKRIAPNADIIIIDGSFRDACVPVALECLKPRGKLIFDNWMQPEVEMQTEETQAIVLALPHQIYKQEGHPYWQTLIATKP